MLQNSADLVKNISRLRRYHHQLLKVNIHFATTFSFCSIQSSPVPPTSSISQILANLQICKFAELSLKSGHHAEHGRSGRRLRAVAQRKINHIGRQLNPDVTSGFLLLIAPLSTRWPCPSTALKTESLTLRRRCSSCPPGTTSPYTIRSSQRPTVR